MSNRALTRLDFDLKVNGAFLKGALISVQDALIKPTRKERKAAGQLVQNQKLVTGFEFEPLKFKVDQYPTGLDSLPVGVPLELVLYKYYRDEDDQTEHGIREHFTAELDKDSVSENKAQELDDIGYVTSNEKIYRKYVDDELVDEMVRKPSRLVLNKEIIFGERARFLGRG